MKSLLLIPYALSFIRLFRSESHVGKVVVMLDSLPLLLTNIKSERSPDPEAMNPFSWCYEFTDLNVFDIFQCTAIIVFIAAETVSSLARGKPFPWAPEPF